MDVPQLIREFLDYLEIERTASPLTIRNYRHYLARFLHFLTGNGTPPLPSSVKTFAVKSSDITQETIRQYRVYLTRFVDGNGMPLRHVTQSYHLIALRSFLKFLAKRGIETVSSDMIALPHTEPRAIKYLERTDIERLLNQPDINTKEGLRDKAILEMLFSTGLRVSELVYLNRSDINLDRREFMVGGSRRRIVFLSERAADWLKRYLATREDDLRPIFIRYSGKTPDENDKTGDSIRLTARSVQRSVEKYVKKAKLMIKITPHGLRHTFATDLLGNGADLRAIQELLGHKNVSTTQIYTHITNPQLKEIHDKFHSK